MKDNRLPKCWAVLNNGSGRFMELILPYIETLSGKPWTGERVNAYYGVGEDKIAHWFVSAKDFGKDVVVLTLDEFEILSTQPKLTELPKYWYIENKYPEIEQYLEKLRGGKFTCKWSFVGIDKNQVNGSNSPEFSFRDHIKITIDEFRELTKSGKSTEDFVLPDKWWIQSTVENYSIIYDWLNKNKTNGIEYSQLNKGDKRSAVCFPDYCGRHQDVGDNTYTQITLEQFKTHVLKQKDMEKEIIGYVFKPGFEKYRGAACNIADCRDLELRNDKTLFAHESLAYTDLNNAGVLNLWFDPVYKQEYPNITINGHKGVFHDDYVEFGCAKFDRDVFYKLADVYAEIDESMSNPTFKTNKRIESVTLGKGVFSIKDICAIAEYFINKEKK